ncbi:MAG TPA: hypothetical protein VHX44_02390, partial [Planctomycetota bacterium]|nr:hypothetical protein [Planctomycetota bacterium]
MADQTTPPAKPEPTDKKGHAPAPEEKTSPEGFALPKNQQLSRGQQRFIWGLVLFVGVLFGAGPITDTLLGRSNHVAYVGNVSEHEILARQGVARRLQEALNPSRDQAGEQFEPARYDRYGREINVYEVWAERIKLARYAESQGLLPGGTALEGLVKEFLNKPLPNNPAKRYVDALQEVQGGDKGVSLEQVRRYLAEERARDLVSMARIVAPVVPVAMGDAVGSLGAMTREDYYKGIKGDQVVIDEVILTAKSLLPEVKDDDAEILRTYDDEKATRFNRPAALETTIAYVDVAALAAKTAVADGDIEAYYNAHKDDYRKPVEPKKPEDKKPEEKKVDAPKEGEAKADAKPDEAKKDEKKPEEPKIEYKALAEVTPEIKTKLARERAELQAKELVRQFDASIEGGELLQQKDNTGFKAAAAKLGVATREKVFIDEPKSGGTLDVGEFGMLSETQLH